MWVRKPPIPIKLCFRKPSVCVSAGANVHRAGLPSLVCWPPLPQANRAVLLSGSAASVTEVAVKMQEAGVMPLRSADLNAFLSVNAQLNCRVRDDVVLATPFEKPLSL